MAPVEVPKQIRTDAARPEDGVAASESERYRAALPAGPATVRIRVIDASGNLGGELRALD